MGKIKRQMQSLKWSIVCYLPVWVIAACIGAVMIGFATNDLQEWYQAKHPEIAFTPYVSYDEYQFHEKLGDVEYVIVFWFISNAQVILMPAWVIFCVMITGILFYDRELKKPIGLLVDASRNIADNRLDFTVEYKKQDELGMLCAAFEEMRLQLYENNLAMWRSLEERKRLNSAFSHDLRTPLTVLRGYVDYLEKYIPDGRVPEEKLLSVISMMNGQITRLEHYTQKMNTVQKLEDIVPNICSISGEKIFSDLAETGRIICGDIFRINGTLGRGNISVDTELVMQVYENLISNALRYAEKSVEVYVDIGENNLTISVLDDGKGFSEEALQHAAQPFFRGEEEPDKTHFGLGLYISRILCEKCGGTLTIENHENGGRAIAKFPCI